MAPQTAISKAVCYKTKNEHLWEKAVHFLLVHQLFLCRFTNCFLHHYPLQRPAAGGEGCAKERSSCANPRE